MHVRRRVSVTAAACERDGGGDERRLQGQRCTWGWGLLSGLTSCQWQAGSRLRCKEGEVTHQKPTENMGQKCAEARVQLQVCDQNCFCVTF
jgi:hypothetical protein